MATMRTAAVADWKALSETPNGESEVVALVCQRLTTSRYLALRRISCQQDADFLVLRGEVPSFYLKQLAQEVVRNVVPGGRIINLLEVRSNTA